MASPTRPSRSALIAASFAGAVAAVPMTRGGAMRMGLASRPGQLNPEIEPVPLCGGIALLAGCAPLVLTEHRKVLLALVPAWALGTADDFHELPATARALTWGLLGAAAAAGARAPSWRAVVASGLATTAVTTGINFLDGIDGLAAGVAGAGAVGIAALGAGDTDLALSLGSGLLGLLCWNRPPARCYLGNGGSSLLGVWLAGAAVDARMNQSSDGWLPALLCLAVPCVETMATMARRFRAGGGYVVRERGHGYDQLVARGMSVALVDAVYGCTQLVASVCAVVVARGSRRSAVVATVVAAGAVATLVRWTGALHPTQ